MSTCTNTLGWKLAQEKTRAYYKEQHNKRITLYNESPNKCSCCDRTLSYEKRKNKFCSSSCAAKINNINVIRHGNPIHNTCLFCGSYIKKAHSIYCNNACQQEYAKNKYIELWLNNPTTYKKLPRFARTYLLNKSDNKCSICCWSEKNQYSNTYPLVIDHIDGNSENNNLSNLRVICPNCDSLTPTYKGLNKGNGRAYRRKRYKEGKSY